VVAADAEQEEEYSRRMASNYFKDREKTVDLQKQIDENKTPL
jgi:hypothetical protein